MMRSDRCWECGRTFGRHDATVRLELRKPDPEDPGRYRVLGTVTVCAATEAEVRRGTGSACAAAFRERSESNGKAVAGLQEH